MEEGAQEDKILERKRESKGERMSIGEWQM
jgi:hypothetical protein